MGIIDKIKAFRGNEKPKYSFDAMYQILEETNQKEQLQALVNQIALANGSEKLALGKTLESRMNALFADKGQEAVAEFIREFSEFTVKLNKSFVPEAKAPVIAEAEISPDTATFQDAESQPRVSPTRVVRPDQFEGLEPVAVAPRTQAQKGEDALKALLAEAQADQQKIDAKYGEIPVKLEHTPVNKESPHIVNPQFKPEDLAWSGPQGRDSQVPPPPLNTL